MIPDPEQERQRLDRLYSGMTTEELEKVAADGADLTDTALASLKTEIAKRGLAIAVNETPAGVDVLEERDLVGIRLFLHLPEALLAKSRLESAGIECFLMDGNMARINWSNLVGGAKLLVNREDADAATAILDEPRPANSDAEGVGEPGDSEQT
jgi:hypothetical protein